MPTLRERLGAWIAGSRHERAGTEPIDHQPIGQALFGPGLGNQPDPQALLRESLGVADIATRAIANRVSCLNPLVKMTRRVMDGTEEEEILDDHPLKDLLDRPHPDFSRESLLRLAGQYLVTAGEFYWLKVGSRIGVPVELHPIPASARPHPIVVGSVTVGYRVQSGPGAWIELPREVVIRGWLPDPENPFGAEGYLGPNAIVTDAMKFAEQHLRAHYESNAVPPAYFDTSEVATQMSAEQIRAFDEQWKRKYNRRHGEAKGIPYVAPLGYTLKELQHQTGAEMEPLLRYWTDIQLANFGVPRSVLGQVVSGDRSSAETNQYVFDLHTVKPIADLIAATLTRQLAPDFDPALFVEFEEFVSEDKEFELKREEMDAKLLLRSPNMIREDKGENPVPWGDLPPAPFTLGPYSGEPPPEPEPMPEQLADLEDEPDEEEPMPDEEERVRSGEGRKRVAWQRQVQREKAFVPTYLRALQGLFRAQRDEALKRLQEQHPRARVEPGDLFNVRDWLRIFQDLLTPIVRRVFQASGDESLADLGLEMEFHFTQAQEHIIQQRGADLVTRINETTRKRLRDQLAEATAQGESIDQIESRVRDVFSGRRDNARTIARTEVLKASQDGQLEGFAQSGVVEGKQWNTSLDDRVRDTHTIDGQQVPLRGVFVLGDGETADAPGIGAGGRSLSAANAINCRCFVTPVVLGET